MAALLGGCARRATTTSLEIDAAEYVLAFDAARETLIDCRFDLDRVDAGAGVISTMPRASAGLFSAWDGEQGGLADELDDSFNAHRRVVRIEFHRLGEEGEGDEALPPGTPVEERGDLRDGTGRIEARVRVVVERRQTPGRTIEPASIRRSQSFIDPALSPRQMAPAYYVSQREDPDLARRIVARIQERLGG